MAYMHAHACDMSCDARLATCKVRSVLNAHAYFLPSSRGAVVELVVDQE